MRLRPAPAVATWFLRLFLSSVEDESVLGDLSEQYQRGRGWLWYWRQVIGIVVLQLYRKAQRLSVSTAHTLSIGHAATLILLVAVISAVLLSDIWLLFLVGILGGIVAGGLITLLGNIPTGLRKSERRDGPVQHPGISISHIPVEGAAGLLFVLATVFIFGTGIQAVREMLVLIAPFGILALGILVYWHKRHPVKIQGLDLNK